MAPKIFRTGATLFQAAAEVWKFPVPVGMGVWVCGCVGVWVWFEFSPNIANISWYLPV